MYMYMYTSVCIVVHVNTSGVINKYNFLKVLWWPRFEDGGVGGSLEAMDPLDNDNEL